MEAAAVPSQKRCQVFLYKKKTDMNLLVILENILILNTVFQLQCLEAGIHVKAFYCQTINLS